MRSPVPPASLCAPVDRSQQGDGNSKRRPKYGQRTSFGQEHGYDSRSAFHGFSWRFRSRSSITSVISTPREQAICLPSRDQSKRNILSVAKAVNCLVATPSIEILPLLVTPA